MDLPVFPEETSGLWANSSYFNRLLKNIEDKVGSKVDTRKMIMVGD